MASLFAMRADRSKMGVWDEAHTRKGTACVTGASGFLGSHVVQQLLERGHRVRGVVRDASDGSHLRRLPEARERLELLSVDLATDTEALVAAVKGSDCVIHTGEDDDENSEAAYRAALRSLENVLKALDETNVKNFILTSSLAAVTPETRPFWLSEVHWADPDAQLARGDWAGAAKTTQEQRAFAWILENGVRYVAICPATLVGPTLRQKTNASMQDFAKLANGQLFATCPDAAASFVDVRDCATHHVIAYENHLVEGRFLSVVESLHWNDLVAALQKTSTGAQLARLPKPCDRVPYASDPDILRPLAEAQRYDKARVTSLYQQDFKVRDVPTLLQDALAALDERGLLSKKKATSPQDDDDVGDEKIDDVVVDDVDDSS